MTTKAKDAPIAKESHDIARLRNRLAKHLDAQNAKYSVAALVRASDLIRKHLTREPARKREGTRRLVVFDQNQHPAKEQGQTAKIRTFVKEQFTL